MSLLRSIRSVLLVLLSLFLTAGALASGQGIGDLFRNASESYEPITMLFAGGCFVSGIGLVMTAVFKFKQVKDNPTQIPFFTPFALLGVGILLIYLPAFISPTEATIFGSSPATQGGFMGDGVSGLPGS